MKKTLIFAAMLFLFACESKLETQIINNLYSLDIPTDLSATKELNKDASLQFQNVLFEKYVVVINEPKDKLTKAYEEANLVFEDNLDFYNNLIIDNVSQSVKNFKKKNIQKTKINNLAAILNDVEGEINGIPVYYNFTIIKGKNHYYQLITWTLKGKREEYKEEFQKIINSFKEI